MSIGEIVILVAGYILCGLWYTYCISRQSDIERQIGGEWRWWEYVIITLLWLLIIFVSGYFYLKLYIKKKYDKGL